MHNEFTAIYEKDDEWYIGYCLEIPGANGQGKTKEECKTNLAEAIALILQHLRECAMQGIPYGAKPEPIVLPDALPEGADYIV